MRRRRLPSTLRTTGATRPWKSRSTAIDEVDVVVHDERVVADAGVDLREVAHGVAERARDERQVGEREALVRPSTRPGAPRARVRRARSRPRSTCTRARSSPSTCTMCSAVRRRMLSNGMTSSRFDVTPLVTGIGAGAGCGAGSGSGTGNGDGAGSGAGAGTGSGAGAGSGPGDGSGGGVGSGANVSAGLDDGAAGAGSGARVAWAASRTSLRVMRPPGPVPWMVSTSRPRSATRRRTIGDVSAASAESPGAAAGRRGRSPTGRGLGCRYRSGRRRVRHRSGVGRFRRPAAGAGTARPARASGSGRGLGCRDGAAGPARRAGGGGGGVAQHREAGADLDRLALGHQDLGDHAGRPARAPRSRPCRSRPRTAARRRRRARRPA